MSLVAPMIRLAQPPTASRKESNRANVAEVLTVHAHGWKSMRHRMPVNPEP